MLDGIQYVMLAGFAKFRLQHFLIIHNLIYGNVYSV